MKVDNETYRTAPYVMDGCRRLVLDLVLVFHQLYFAMDSFTIVYSIVLIELLLFVFLGETLRFHSFPLRHLRSPSAMEIIFFHLTSYFSNLLRKRRTQCLDTIVYIAPTPYSYLLYARKMGETEKKKTNN